MGKKLIDANYAAIDIGTNAVRLLIKHVEELPGGGARFSKELLLRVPLRLGFDVFDSGVISEKKIGKMLRLMKAYRHLMKLYDVADYRACATSALRDAANGGELAERVNRATGIKIEIIAGQEEALMIYNNHVERMEDSKGRFMYVDVGGGSTEVNMLSDGELVYSHSYNIGTVRMLRSAVDPAEWNCLRSDMERLAAAYPGTDIVGSGGNINKYYKLAAAGAAKRNRVPVAEIGRLYDELRSLTVEERMERFGLKPDRADVIVPAGQIFVMIAGILGASFIHIPVIGLSDGIIDGLFESRRARG